MLHCVYVVPVGASGDWGKRDQYQPRDTKEEHVGFNRTQAYFVEDTDFFSRGNY